MGHLYHGELLVITRGYIREIHRVERFSDQNEPRLRSGGVSIQQQQAQIRRRPGLVEFHKKRLGCKSTELVN
jgi:hypothetical protein